MKERPLYMVVLKGKKAYISKDTLMASPTAGPFVFESYQNATFAFEETYGADNPFVGCEVVKLAAFSATAEDDE